MNLKQLIVFGIENSQEPVIKNPILRAALQEPRITAQEPRNMYAGGQLVAPSVDGSRPGYAGEVDAGFYQKIINNYKNSVAEDFASGDMSKTGSWRNYLQKKYPKNWKKIQATVLKSDLQSPSRYQFSFKNKLMKNLIEEANKGERFVDMKEIYDKVSTPIERGDRPGQLKARSLKEMGEWVDPKLPKLQTQEQKILKVFDSIIKNNEVLELKNPNFKFIKNIKEGTTIEASLIRKIIGERTGTGSYNTITSALAKHPKMKQKKFRKIFDYMSRAHVNDFEGYRFKDAFDYATDRRSGAAYFTNVNKNIMYKNPDVNIMNYALRHWDGNNFNGIDSLEKGNRIQFFDKKTGDPIKWKSGLRLSPRNVYFTMDGNPMQWNTQTLKTHGKTSGLFKEVVDITNSYYKTSNKWVSDGKGGKIRFGELIGKNNMAIGHNAPGGVKAEPFKNFQLQSKKMNTALYHATKHIKNKDLQKQVIGKIYGSLSTLKGDKYIDKFITDFPTTSYKEAGQKILTAPDQKWQKWSTKKQAELFKISGLKQKDITALEGMKSTQKASMLKELGYGKHCKASGGRVGFADAGSVRGELACIMDDVKKTRADMKSPNVEVRAMAKTKQTKALQLASKMPQIAKFLKTGFQVGAAGLKGLFNLSGVGQPIAYAIEGLVEGGFYDHYRRKGYNHEQAMAETLTPGLIAGRPHGVPWYGGSEKLREKELIGDPKQNPKVAQYVAALKEQDRIYEAIGAKEQAKKEAGLAETGFDATLLPADLAAASEDVQDLARSGAYGRVDRTLDPESMASQAYNIAVEQQEGKDIQRKKEYLEKVDPGALEREEEILSRPSQLKKRYEEMDEMYADYSNEEIDEILLKMYGTSMKELGSDYSYGSINEYFKNKDKSSYFAENFRTEKAGGGIAGIRRPGAIPPKSGPMPDASGLSTLYNRVKRI